MTQFGLLAIAITFLTSCERQEQLPIFSGSVESIYFLDDHDKTVGITRFDKGRPATSTTIKEDVFVEVHKEWVVVKLLNRRDYARIVPRERVREIIVGTQEGNEVNIPR